MSEATLSQPVEVLCFGDSILAWSESHLFPDIRRRYASYSIVDRSHHGHNSTEGLRVVKAENLKNRSVRCAILNFGTNNACMNDKRGSTQDKFFADMIEMILYLLEVVGVDEVIVSVPFPLGCLEERKNGKILRTFSHSESYSDVLQRLVFHMPDACRGRVKLADPRPELAERAKEGIFMSHLVTDAVHLNERGYKVLKSVLIRILDDILDVASTPPS